jgi:hypothetical protein
MKLAWDKTGERYYETGVDRGVVYPQVAGAYPAGEAWNGLINVTLSPSGAEATALYANNKKYLNLISLEELSYSIEAYTYPDSFAQCNGEAEMVKGVRVSQQKRVPFGFTFRNLIGSDAEGTAEGYKIHIIYGSTAAPSENANATVNDSPEAKTMSWECNTTPVDITGFEPSSHIEIDSRTLTASALKALEDALYGTESEEAHLPLPDELAELVGKTA